MYLEHLDQTLIHQLQQRRGVGLKKDELDVRVQVLKHVRMGGSVAEDHHDTLEEALRRAILLQLVHQGSLAVCLKKCPVIQLLESVYQWTGRLVLS